MKVLSSFPPLFRFLIAVTALNLVVFVILRVIFFFTFGSHALSESWPDVLYALYLGVKFDLRLALLLGLPVLLLGWLPGVNPVRNRPASWFWQAYFTFVWIAALFLYFVDFGHYEYLGQRLNASIFDHVTPADIALRMVWETYPVIWGVLALVTLGLVYAFVLRLTVGRLQASQSPPGRVVARVAIVFAFAFVYLLGIYGKWSWYPLRWSDAYFSTSEPVAALALNPILFLSDSYRNRRGNYKTSTVRQYYPRIAELLEVSDVDIERLNFSRFQPGQKNRVRQPNLIIIHLESFAAYKTGIFGNKLKPTPHFDRLARNGAFFTNFFVPAGPTARSVFTMITGIPDFNPGRSASRNPLVVNQHTLITALHGYDKYYFLGGSATWGNIRGVLAHNIPDLTIFEEGNYDAERVDTWGVSDLAMFERAHEVFQKRDRPFFAFIQTAGNHKPYNLPADTRDFTLSDLDDKTLEDNSFKSLAAYNSLRFFDFSLGHFFRLAASGRYFRDTIFVMYGDHGTNAANNIPYETLRLTQHHVPFVIYAPHLVKGRRVDDIASLVDLLPTVVKIMGIEYVNTTMGRDLFAARPDSKRFALVVGGLLTNEFLYRSDPRGASHLYRYRSADSATMDLSEKYPEKTADLKELHDALYETSRYLLHNNRPRPHEAKPLTPAVKQATK